MRLISKAGCPFAQRTATVLEAKGLTYDLEQIDVDNKPDWFLAMSPLAKVPVLKTEAGVLVESLAINEYLEEAYPAPSLTPRDLVARARMRFWILFDETQLTPAFYRLLLAKGSDAEQRYRETYLRHLTFLEDEGLAGAAPFLLGSEMSLADVALITHLQRMPVLIAHRGIRQPAPGGPLERWLRVMNDQPAVKAATPDEQTIVNDMAPYVARTAYGTTAKDMLAD